MNLSPLLIIAPLLIAAIVAVRAPTPIWDLFGEADQGPMDFADWRGDQTPGYLVCPPGACSNASATAPVVQCTEDRLFQALNEVLAARGADITESNPASGSLRAVDRTPILRFPDTVNAAVRAADGGSTLFLLSRSLMGRDDLGTNRRRVDDILAELAEACDGPD